MILRPCSALTTLPGASEATVNARPVVALTQLSDAGSNWAVKGASSGRDRLRTEALGLSGRSVQKTIGLRCTVVGPQSAAIFLLAVTRRTGVGGFSSFTAPIHFDKMTLHPLLLMSKSQPFGIFQPRAGTRSHFALRPDSAFIASCQNHHSQQL